MSNMLKGRWVIGFLALLSLSPSGVEAWEDPAPPGVVISLQGDITSAQTVFLRRGLEKARDGGGEIIIFDINTFGGRVDSALQMATLIGAVDDAFTVAFISAGSESLGVSWSAGAIISLACDAIYMAEGTSFGAAAPVYLAEGKTTAAPEKEVAAVRAQMAALAEKNGYPRGIALAMVDQDEELVEVFIDGETRVAARRDMPDLEREAEEGGLSLKEGKILSPKGKLLALTAGEMERYGVSSGTVDDREDLLSRLGLSPGEVEELTPSRADRLVAILTSTAVISLLVIIGFIAIYIEISSPGFGIPGMVAILAFSVVFLGSSMLGKVGSLELLIFLAGLILLAAEVFLIPGFGIAGIGGIIFMVGSLVLSRQEFIVPEFHWEWEIFRSNVFTIVGSLLAALIIVAALVSLFPKIRPLRRLALEDAPGGGAESRRPKAAFSDVPEKAVGEIGPGMTGISLTALRPVGKIEIGGRSLIAQTRGEFLGASRPVRVLEVRETYVLVGEE